MKRPTPEMVEIFAKINRSFPMFLEWIGEWKQEELERLPVLADNLGRAQGRCQVLGELYKALQEAPEHMAKLK